MNMLKNAIGLTVLLLLTGLFQSTTFPTNVETTTIESANTSSKAGADLLVMSFGTKKKLVVTGVNDGCRGTQYVWSTGETTSSIVVEKPGTYSVYVQDCDACSFCWQELIESIVW